MLRRVLQLLGQQPIGQQPNLTAGPACQPVPYVQRLPFRPAMLCLTSCCEGGASSRLRRCQRSALKGARSRGATWWLIRLSSGSLSLI